MGLIENFKTLLPNKYLLKKPLHLNYLMKNPLNDTYLMKNPLHNISCDEKSAK